MLESQASAFVDMLQFINGLEWIRPAKGGAKFCPSCYAYEHSGHVKTCAFVALVNRVVQENFQQNTLDTIRVFCQNGITAMKEGDMNVLEELAYPF